MSISHENLHTTAESLNVCKIQNYNNDIINNNYPNTTNDNNTNNVGPKEYRWNKLCNEVTMLPERILVWQKVFENLKEFFTFYSV